MDRAGREAGTEFEPSWGCSGSVEDGERNGYSDKPSQLKIELEKFRRANEGCSNEVSG